MKITILNGNSSIENAAFDEYTNELAEKLESNGHSAKALQLRDMDIRYCIGCFGCWVKTPGECSTAVDDTQEIRREYINSDLVIFASPIIMGFTSALLKKAHDRNLGLILPYLVIDQEESHHLARYDKYPFMGLLLDKGEDADDEDVKIISDCYMRDAINFKTSLRFTKLTSNPIEEVLDEINSI